MSIGISSNSAGKSRETDAIVHESRGRMLAKLPKRKANKIHVPDEITREKLEPDRKKQEEMDKFCSNCSKSPLTNASPSTIVIIWFSFGFHNFVRPFLDLGTVETSAIASVMLIYIQEGSGKPCCTCRN